MRGRARLILLLALAAFTPPERVTLGVPAVLLNHRTLLGDPPESCFDRGSWPIVQVRPGALHQPRAIFHLGSKTIPAELIVRHRDVSSLLELRTSEPLSDPIRLELLDGHTTVREWNIRWRPGPEDVAAVAAAVAHRKNARHDEARKTLAEALPGADAWSRMWIQRELGNVDFMAGDHQQAERHWIATASSAAELGAWTELGFRLRGVAFLRYSREDNFGALPFLERARSIGLRFDDTCAIQQNEYYAGLLEARFGRYERAHVHLRRAAELARRSCTEMYVVDAAQALAVDLAEVGRYREAIAVFDDVKLPDDAGASALARHLANGAWIRASAIQAGVLENEYSRVEADYRRAIALLEAAGTPQRRANALSRLAFVAQARGDLVEAERRLAELDRLPPEHTAPGRAFLAIVRARVAIERGRLDEARVALEAIYDQSRASRGGSADESLAAHMLLGEIAFRKNELREAANIFAAAMSEVDELAARLEGPKTRGPLFFKYREIAERRADALLRRGAAEEAFAVLDSVRAAAIGDLQARLIPERASTEWANYRRLRADLETRETRSCRAEPEPRRAACEARLARARVEAAEALQRVYAASGRKIPRAIPAAELAPRLQKILGADELVAAVFRIGEEWIYFRLDRRGLRHQRSAEPPRAEFPPSAHIYLILGEGTAPFDPWLDVAAQISISRLPVAAMLLEDPPANFRGRLFVADADGTLPEARAQAGRLAERTGPSELLIGAAATPEAVLAAWPGRALVHAAVHGTLRELDPWNSKLILAGDHGLELHDFLAARAAAGLVVLAACWSGAEYREGDLGIVEALLSSGSRSVLTAVDEVERVSAVQFLESFYDAGGAESPAKALREAVRESQARGDRAWKSFRLWGRR